MNPIIQNAISWAIKLGFSEDWLKKIEEYDVCCGDLIPFDEKNKILFEKNDLMLNLVSYLNYCDLAKSFYDEKQIPEHIMIDTLLDIRIWAYRHKEIFEIGRAHV